MDYRTPETHCLNTNKNVINKNLMMDMMNINVNF